MPDQPVKLPPGYTLEEDVKLPPGYTLESSTPADTSVIDNPNNKLIGTSNGIPVYRAVDAPMFNRDGQIMRQPDHPLTPTEETLLAPIRYFKEGMTQLGQGLHGLTHPESADQMAHSASDTIRGGMQVATPFALPEMIAHPLATMTGLATFGGTQQLLERTASGMGLPEGWSRLAGDLAGIYGGQKVYRWLADVAKIPDGKVADAIYEKLQMNVAALEDPNLDPSQKATVKASIDALMSSLRQEEGWKFPAVFANPNQLERDAYDYMRRDVGTAPHAGQATGSTFVQGAQKLSGYTPAGAYMDAKTAQTDLDALRARATKLTGEAQPTEGPSREFYGDFEQRVNGTPAVNVRLGVDKDGSFVNGDVKVPVDITELKDEMQPLFEKMDMIPGLDKNTSWAYSTLKALLNSHDHITAPTAEFALGNFKKAARNEPGGISEAIVKQIIPRLQAAIGRAVRAHVGEEGLVVLEKGRAAAAKEAGADWLAEQFKHAQQEGGFGHEKALWNSWVKMNDTTNRTMFTPAQVAELDKFFLGLKMRAENPNPSGTALVGAVSGQAGALAAGYANPAFWLGELGAAGISKLLRSDAGVKLLTEGLRIPRTSSRARFIERQLKEILGNEGGQQGPPAGGGQPGGQGGFVNKAKQAFERLKNEEEGSVKLPGGSKPESGPHGPIFREFSRKPAEAIAKLQAEQTGEVPRVWRHPQLGWIDLVWGNERGGLSHIISKHVEGKKDLKLEDLAEMLPRMRVIKNDGRTARLETKTHEAGVRLDFDGKRKRWLVTAYEKPPTGGSPLVPGSP